VEKAQVRKETEKRAMKIEKKTKQNKFWLSTTAGSANRHQLQSIEEVNSIAKRERERERERENGRETWRDDGDQEGKFAWFK
jgi:ribosomal 30S subunit maturation factor RimM